MKPSISFITLFLLFVFSISFKINAQEIKTKSFSLSLMGGVALPMLEFKDTESFDAGFAKLGFSFAIEGDYRINSYSFWGTNIIFSYNTINRDVLKTKLGNSLAITEEYQTIWTVNGIGFDIVRSSKTSIHLLLQGGVLISRIPDMSRVVNGVTIKQSATNEATYRYTGGIGGGIKSDNLRIGFLFLRSTPKYDLTGSIDLYGNEKISATVKGVKLPVSILNIFIGIIF